MIIHVLEDMEGRIDFLRSLVEHCKDVKISWHNNVNSFIREFPENPGLVILDHDLGGVPTDLAIASRDIDGQSGTDAVRRMPNVSCPVLIWSMNPVRAPIMKQDLQRRGMHVAWYPFGSSSCTSAITHVLLAATRA
ncbi:hypothetical protein HC928_02590 [bacterium]|nr:hypothetical protein [bacterium]